MFTSLVASLLLFQAPVSPPVAAPTTSIAFKDGFFLVTDSTGTTKVNSRIWAKAKPTEFSLKQGSTTISWLKGAMTVRGRGKPTTYRFSDFPANPAFFTEDQISTNNSQIVLKARTKEVSALSGWEVIGSTLYVLLRWDDRGGNPWAEALYSANLSQSPIKFKPVAGGSSITSIATGSIDDQLVTSGQSLAFVGRQDGDWGVAIWDSGNTVFNFNPSWTTRPTVLGWNTSRTLVGFRETTRYKTNIIGYVGLQKDSRVNLAESRDSVSFPGDWFDVVAITRSDAVLLRSSESGLELKLPPNVGVRTISQGVLVWVPKENPSSAFLYSKTSLRAIAKWAGSPKKTPAKVTKPAAKRPSKTKI